jgi:hypothetical protein
MVRNRVRVRPVVAAGLVLAALVLAAIAQAQDGAAPPRVVSIVDASSSDQSWTASPSRRSWAFRSEPDSR